MRLIEKTLLAFSSVLMFASCSSTKVFVTNTKTINVLPPSCIERETDKIYMLTATFGENNFSTPVYLTVNKKEISMLMVSDFGTTLAKLFYNGEKCTLESTVLPKKIAPQYLVADLEYTFGDIVEIETELRKAGLTFSVISEFGSESSPGVSAPNHQFRFIFDGKKKIAQIDISEDGTIEIENYLRNYKYKLVEISDDLEVSE